MLRRIRGAVGMGLLWAVGWAVGGILIGVTSLLTPGLPWDAFFEVFDAPLPALAMPGFFAGALFSVVLGIAARHCRFEELSLPAFTGWGALGGFLLSLVPLTALIDGSLAIGFIISGTLTCLGAVSAAATLTVARRGENREPLEAGGDTKQLGG